MLFHNLLAFSEWFRYNNCILYTMCREKHCRRAGNQERNGNLMEQISTVSLRAMAKINLGLDVLRRREDGYHEVKMVMQTIRLFDRLTLTVSEKPGIRLVSNRHFLPTDDTNLAVRAARLLMEEKGEEKGLFIELEKRIPVSAGMAGGSSDAAAALVGVNRLFGYDFSREELQERGVKIGADVPYCLMRGTVLAEGIGEKLTALPSCPECAVLIAKPPVSVSTKFVYENLHADTIAESEHPDIDGLTAAIRRGSLADMIPSMGNVLERVSIPAYPVIGKIKEQVNETGALIALMSGSGPTVFGLYESMEQCREARDFLLKKGDAAVAYAADLFHPM